jgi:hypothetical protein
MVAAPNHLRDALLPNDGGFWERAAELREELRGRVSTDSAELIRQDRDVR